MWIVYRRRPEAGIWSRAKGVFSSRRSALELKNALCSKGYEAFIRCAQAPVEIVPTQT